MSERALIDAVLADFDDDLPRLAYADWLDEQGRADRAELIRVQVELDRLPVLRRKYHDRAPQVVGRRMELFGREIQLLDDRPDSTGRPNKFLWMGQATFEMTVMGRSAPEDTARHLAWRRGFVWRVGCHGDDLLNYMDQAVTENPVEEVFLSGWPTQSGWLTCMRFDVSDGGIVSRRWPKVRHWGLPADPVLDHPTTYEQYHANMIQEIMNSMGVTRRAFDGDRYGTSPMRAAYQAWLENRRVIIGRTVF